MEGAEPMEADTDLEEGDEEESVGKNADNSPPLGMLFVTLGLIVGSSLLFVLIEWLLKLMQH